MADPEQEAEPFAIYWTLAPRGLVLVLDPVHSRVCSSERCLRSLEPEHHLPRIHLHVVVLDRCDRANIQILAQGLLELSKHAPVIVNEPEGVQ